MKKLTAVVCTGVLALALAVPAYGQGVAVGAKAGLNFASLGGDVDDTSTRTALVFGGAFGLDLGPLFGIHAEALYSAKGGKFEDSVEGVTVEATTKLNYLEIPVLAMVSVPTPGAGVRPRVYAGPAVAIELSCDVEVTALGMSDEAGCDDDVFEGELARKSVDFGLIVGGGVDLPMGPGSLTVDGRYNLGLNDISDVPGDPFSVKNRTIQVLAGYMLRLGV